MENNKITYRKIKELQQADIRLKSIHMDIYRKFSSPFTWFFVKLGTSPNAITILTFLVCIAGGVFLALGTYLYLIIGFLIFILFKILDDSDGEVARVQNKVSIEGLFYDRLSHYIHTCCFGLGLGFGLYRLYQSEIYLILGFLFTLVVVSENARKDLLKSISRKNIINKKINIKNKFGKDTPDSCLWQKLMSEIYGGRSWAKANIISKIMKVYPFQGLLYSDTFITPIFLVLTIGEYILNVLFGFPDACAYVVGLIPLYFLLVSLIKLVNITIFIFDLKRNMYITKTLQKLQNR